MSKPVILKTYYREETLEIAYRGDSFETNIYSGDYVSYRIYLGGGIRVFSSPLNQEHRIKPFIDKYRGIVVDKLSFEYKFYNGRYSIGREIDIDTAKEITGIIWEKFREYGLNSEIIIVSRHTITKHLVEDYNVEAIDDRWIHELYIYPYTIYMGRLVSSGKLIAFNDPGILKKEIDNIIKSMVRKIEIQLKTRRFNPVYTGRWKTILAGDSACVFYHELTHLLQADEPVKLPLEKEIGGELNIVEDPFYPGLLQRVFDDELYPGWRRTLVEDGVVIDYLRNRLTSQDSKPGNGRGIFTKPKPLYHQLIVKPGDWSIDEALEEFKKIIYVEDILKAELYENYIAIIPENGLVYENNKWIPVRGFIIRIPVDQLNNVLIGVTKTINMRYGFEKNNPVYEVAPSTILEARITV